MGRPVARLAELAQGGIPSRAYPGFLLPSVETMVLQQVFSRTRKASPDLLAHAEIAGVLWARRSEFNAGRMLDLAGGEGLYGILRSVLSNTDAALPGVIPAALFRREGRPADWTPLSVRRGTLSSSRARTRQSLWSMWAAPALGGGRPLATASWIWRRAFPPQPVLAHLTGGRCGLPATGTRLGRLVHANPVNMSQR